jgi:putative oxidoreductase
MAFFPRITDTTAPASTLLIRLAVGAVFVSEGIQKFIDPANVGAGRFEKIGFPNPSLTAQFVGTCEIVCGTLVLVGLLTRLATLPLIVIMLTAISTTKIPILMEKGFWSMAHEARTDYAMSLGSLFLLIVGAGRWSLDSKMSAR